MRNILLVLSGPSGVGKGTLKERLMRSDEFVFSVSCTTRAPREGEQNGVDYFYLSREEFEKRIARGDFLEYDEHFGNYYGTLRSHVEGRLSEKSVILDIDVVGALNVKRCYPDAVLVMLLPPDVKTLEQRLIGRDSETAAERENRLARVRFELGKQGEFDYTVVNDDLSEAERRLWKIVTDEKNRE